MTEELRGPGGHVLRIVTDTGELLEMEASYAGDTPLPPAHLHPSQDEHFEVLEGAMDTVIDGTHRRYAQGESFAVPAGTPHQMTGDGPARVSWQVRPALRTAEFFRRLYGSGPDSAQALGLLFLEEFEAEFRLADLPEPA